MCASGYWWILRRGARMSPDSGWFQDLPGHLARFLHRSKLRPAQPRSNCCGSMLFDAVSAMTVQACITVTTMPLLIESICT